MKLKPMADNILLKAAEAQETTASGIILATTNKEKPAIFEVVSAGPEVKGIAAGDKVIVGKFVGKEALAAVGPPHFELRRAGFCHQVGRTSNVRYNRMCEGIVQYHCRQSLVPVGIALQPVAAVAHPTHGRQGVDVCVGRCLDILYTRQ